MGNSSRSSIPELHVSVSGSSSLWNPCRLHLLNHSVPWLFPPSAPVILGELYTFGKSCTGQFEGSEGWIASITNQCTFLETSISFQWGSGMNLHLPNFSGIFLETYWATSALLRAELSHRSYNPELVWNSLLESCLLPTGSWGFGAKQPVPYTHIPCVILHGKYNSSEI